MKFLGYILAYSLLWLLHLLPEALLYLLSDFLYFLGYHVFGYRRSVVFNNLRRAFPSYPDKEIRQIARRFYHHLSDLLLESAVFPFYKQKRALKRIRYKNIELLRDLHASGKHVMAVTGHYGNWEYLSTLGLASPYPIIGIYKPLKNKHFDRMYIRARTRFGARVSPMERVVRDLMEFHRRKEAALTIFLGDQRPMRHQIQFWTPFFGIMTPVYLGSEKLARKLDAAVVFVKNRKIRRGRYEAEFQLISSEPQKTAAYEITRKHVALLEELIREDPAYWLWSHRRWKHDYEAFAETDPTNG